MKTVDYIDGQGREAVILSVGYDELVEAIANLEELRNILYMKILREGKGDDRQKIEDADALKHDFDVAIQAMTMLAVNLDLEYGKED